MALPTTASFSGVVVEINTGTAQAPVWTAPCGFDTKALKMSAASSSASVPDCQNPEAPAWDVKGVDTLSGQITGSGVMATENQATWDQWFDSGLTKPVRMRVTDKTGAAVGYREGDAILTDLSDSVALKSNGNLVQRAVTIDSAGPWPWSAGAPT